MESVLTWIKRLGSNRSTEEAQSPSLSGERMLRVSESFNSVGTAAGPIALNHLCFFRAADVVNGIAPLRGARARRLEGLQQSFGVFDTRGERP